MASKFEKRGFEEKSVTLYNSVTFNKQPYVQQKKKKKCSKNLQYHENAFEQQYTFLWNEKKCNNINNNNNLAYRSRTSH